MSLTVGSLFSGCGMLDFGLEQAGMKTIWQVEFDDWCREVALPQNFPNTEKFRDVREVGKHNLGRVNVICGGFPCPDVSQLNKDGLGLDGERSGLWFEQFRIIRELLPDYALVENVSKLLIFGLDRILSDLASIGYDAEWQVIRASAFGLPQERKRIFIIAYPKSDRPIQIPIFSRNYLQGMHSQAHQFCYGTPVSFKDLQYNYPQIPQHLRVDNGTTYELSEIERAIKAYGNGVAVPVAKFIGEQIIRFDKEIKEYEQNNHPPSPILTATSE